MHCHVLVTCKPLWPTSLVSSCCNHGGPALFGLSGVSGANNCGGSQVYMVVVGSNNLQTIAELGPSFKCESSVPNIHIDGRCGVLLGGAGDKLFQQVTGVGLCPHRLESLVLADTKGKLLVNVCGECDTFGGQLPPLQHLNGNSTPVQQLGIVVWCVTNWRSSFLQVVCHNSMLNR